MPSPTKPSSSPTAPLDSPSQPTSAANQSTAAPLNSFPSVSTPTKGSTAAASAPNSPESAIDTTLLTFGSLSLTDQPQHGPPMLAGATVDSYRNFPLLLRPGTEGLTREGAAVALGEVTTAPGQALRRGKCKFFNASKVCWIGAGSGRTVELTVELQGFGFILDSDSPSINGDEGAFLPPGSSHLANPLPREQYLYTTRPSRPSKAVLMRFALSSKCVFHSLDCVPKADRVDSQGEDVEYYVVRGPKGWQAQHVTGPQGEPAPPTAVSSLATF